MKKLKIDKKLARAILRFLSNAIESKLYSGEFEDQLIERLSKIILNGDDVISITLSIDTVYADIRMLRENLTKGKNVLVEAHITKTKTNDTP